ncbi:MAG TPA: hypothetical protein VKA80_02435 [Beijerinckiaceae bacterium]|nr:hypothetical protein [Beijerinckiaceae bacterium]
MPADTDTDLDIEKENARAVTEYEASQWWWHLPDFIKHSYPFDVPPDRMCYAKEMFDAVHPYRTCPRGECRRARECQGGDGPACYRADRKNLRQLLFLMWMTIYCNATPAECNGAFKRSGSPFRFPKKWAGEEEEALASRENESAGPQAPARGSGRRKRSR